MMAVDDPGNIALGRTAPISSPMPALIARSAPPTDPLESALHAHLQAGGSPVTAPGLPFTPAPGVEALLHEVISVHGAPPGRRLAHYIFFAELIAAGATQEFARNALELSGRDAHLAYRLRLCKALLRVGSPPHRLPSLRNFLRRRRELDLDVFLNDMAELCSPGVLAQWMEEGSELVLFHVWEHAPNLFRRGPRYMREEHLLPHGCAYSVIHRIKEPYPLPEPFEAQLMIFDSEERGWAAQPRLYGGPAQWLAHIMQGRSLRTPKEPDGYRLAPRAASIFQTVCSAHGSDRLHARFGIPHHLFFAHMIANGAEREFALMATVAYLDEAVTYSWVDDCLILLRLNYPADQLVALADYLRENMLMLTLMKGVTARSLLRRVAAWHHELGRQGRVDQLVGELAVSEFPRLGIPAHIIDHPEGCYVITQLVDMEALRTEGNTLRHCAITYAREMARGRTHLFSMRKAERHEPLITIEVRKGGVWQARGACNRPPTMSEREVILAWVAAFPELLPHGFISH
jgi:hypothetical protein